MKLDLSQECEVIQKMTDHSVMMTDLVGDDDALVALVTQLALSIMNMFELKKTKQNAANVLMREAMDKAIKGVGLKRLEED